MGDIAIRIEGLTELRRALTATDRALPKELRRELTFEANVVVGHIKRAIPSNTGRARSSVRVVGGANRGGITVDLKAGGGRVPYFGWLEFGGKLPDKRPRTKKALAWGGADHPSAGAAGAERTKVSEGRYVRPTVKRHREELAQAMEVAFIRAKTKAGL